MIDPDNDADMLTLEFEAVAAQVANGVCHICDEALDPTAPKWVSYYAGRHETAEHVAAVLGPVDTDDPTVHQRCRQAQLREAAEERRGWRDER